MAKQRTVQIGGNLTQNATRLLADLQSVMLVSKSGILNRAIEYWLAYPTSEPQARPFEIDGNAGSFVAVAVTPPVGNLLKAYAVEYGCTPMRIIEAALIQWFEEVGGSLIYRLSTAKPATPERKPKPAPKPAPVPAIAPSKPPEEDDDDDDLSPTEILKAQLVHYQKHGNKMRVAQIIRQLQQLEAAA